MSYQQCRGPRIILCFTAVLIFSASLFAQQRIAVDVNASDAAKGVLHVDETVSVRPGRFDLYYPKWIPGEHTPTGPINDMVNLHIRAGGREIAWQRDDIDMFAFHLTVPAGVRSVRVTFDDAAQPGTTATAELARVKWNRLLLYQRGVPDDRIVVTGSITPPAGWQYATALTATGTSGGKIQFAPVTLERFIDSPAIIAHYLKKVPLSSGGVSHEIDLAADTAEALNYTPEMLEGWKNLVTQANLAFGAHHYNSYKFLVTFSDFGGSEGLEHNESSEDGTRLATLTDPEDLADFADLLSHEYTHSWNGKYRRPVGLATPDYEKPMVGDLLWVYEGLTEYMGNVLPARSGMWTPEICRETFADVAAQMQYQSGRRWRPLVDTARAVQLTYSGAANWSNERRGADYYYEGQLIWLEADVLIRQKSGGKRSLDDFLHRFYGPPSTGPLIRPYSLADVVAALNAVVPYDWASFLRDRVYKVQNDAPLAGFTNGGWDLEFNSTPNVRLAGRERLRDYRNLTYSLGFIVGPDGSISDVAPDSPAGRSGVVPGMRLTEENGKDFDLDALSKAVANSPTVRQPIKLNIEFQGEKQVINIDYHGGDKYPHLVRNSSPDIFAAIIAPR